MGVWKGVAMDCLKFHPGPPCPTLLRPLKQRARKADGLRPSSTPLDAPRRTPTIPSLTRFDPRYQGGEATVTITVTDEEMERREEQKKNEERKQKEEEEQRKLSSAFLPVMGALQGQCHD
jgi:hypothetical protein